MAKESAYAKRLRALLAEGGALRIITNEHACGAGKHPDIEGFDAEKCAAFLVEETDEEGDVFLGPCPLTDPRHFVIHDVIEIEGPGSNGAYRARSAEGDLTLGSAETLVKRLQEASAAGA